MIYIYITKISFVVVFLCGRNKMTTTTHTKEKRQDCFDQNRTLDIQCEANRIMYTYLYVCTKRYIFLSSSFEKTPRNGYLHHHILWDIHIQNDGANYRIHIFKIDLAILSNVLLYFSALYHTIVRNVRKCHACNHGLGLQKSNNATLQN